MTDLRPLLLPTFPIASDYFSLECVRDSAPDGENALWVELRLTCWENSGGGERCIREVKQQSVLLVPAEHRDDPRLEAWLLGLREALLHVMKSQDPGVGRDDEDAICAPNALGNMFPSDLVQPEVLKLARPRTPEDFTRALLGSKRRLGRLRFPPA